MSQSINVDKKLAMLLFFIAIICIFIANNADVFISAESDGYFHALGAYFFDDIAKWWFSHPTLSLEAVKSFVHDYELQYKFFGGISYYPPLQSVLVAMVAFFMGKSQIAYYLITAAETVLTMFIAYHFYRMLYKEKREWILWLVMLLIAFNASVFTMSASFSHDPGVMLFATATAFFVVRFMKFEERKDLYLTAASLGLGIITKFTFVIFIPMVFLSLLLERRVRLLLKEKKALLKATAIFFLILSPWLLMEYVFMTMGISKLGERVGDVFGGGYTVQGILANVSNTIAYVFGLHVMLFFILYWLWKSKKVTGEITLAVVIISYSLFFNIIPNVQFRYLAALVPLATVLVVRGMQTLYDSRKSSVVPAIIVVLFIISVLSSYGFSLDRRISQASTDFVAPAIYISERMTNRTTVLSDFSRMQSVPFVVFGDKNVIIERQPYVADGGEEELKIMLDSKDYMRRPHKPEYEKFNLTPPAIEWVIVHEYWDGEEGAGYKLKDVIDRRDDFDSVMVMEGNWPGNRVFIYKRKASFFS